MLYTNEDMDSVNFKEYTKRNSTYIPEIIAEIYTKEDRRLMRQLLEKRLVEKEHGKPKKYLLLLEMYTHGNIEFVLRFYLIFE